MLGVGLLFGAWPLFLSRSGLSGLSASATFAMINVLILMPFALSIGNLSNIFATPDIRWWPLLIAGLLGASGLLLFNHTLVSAGPEHAGRLFVLMIVVQIAVPALHEIVMQGTIDFRTGIGFVLALGAAILLI